MFCTYCGRQALSGDALCAACGSRLGAQLQAPSEGPAPAPEAPPATAPSNDGASKVGPTQSTLAWIGQIIAIVGAFKLLGVLGGGAAIVSYYALKSKLGWGGAAAAAVVIGFVVLMGARALLQTH